MATQIKPRAKRVVAKKKKINPIQTGIVRTLVDSSAIKSIGYANKVLEVEFHTGVIYQYFNIPKIVYADLLSAPSIGLFFQVYVRNKNYNYKIKKSKK